MHRRSLVARRRRKASAISGRRHWPLRQAGRLRLRGSVGAWRGDGMAAPARAGKRERGHVPARWVGNWGSVGGRMQAEAGVHRILHCSPVYTRPAQNCSDGSKGHAGRVVCKTPLHPHPNTGAAVAIRQYSAYLHLWHGSSSLRFLPSKHRR
jgi:hypothetical protein